MATINDKFFADLAKGATWAAGVAFQRSNPLPLDKYSVFESIAAAEEYAASNVVAYPGQIVAAVNEGVMEVFVLAEKANEVAEGEEQTYSLVLQEMGGKIELDPNSMNLNSLGLLEMLGFENAENLTLPQKKDGKVQWLPISAIAQGDGNDNTTYTFALGQDGKSIDIITYENGVAVKGEDDQIVVQNIALDIYTKSEVDAAIKVEADRAKEVEGALDERLTALSDAMGEHETAAEEALALKANAADVYTRTETDGKISDAVKGILGEDVSEAYDTLVEIQKLMESDDTASAELLAKANANEEAIAKLNGEVTEDGSVAKKISDAIVAENLGQYAKAAEVEETYATKEELGDYAKSADVESSYAKKTDLDAYAKSEDVAETYVTKAAANAENGLRFINQTEIDKLKALNLDGEDVTISGSVNANQVKELYDTVVSIVKGSTTDLNPDTPDEVETGLHIEEGAQVNKIEKVIFNGAEATIEGKVATIGGEFYNKEEVDAKVKTASDAAGAAQSAAEAAQNKADANASTLSTTNETVAGHTTKISSLEQASTQHGAEIQAIQGTMGTHTTDIAQLKTDVQAAAAAASANNTKIGELVASDETINTELLRLESAKANASDVYDKDEIDAKVQELEDAAYDDTVLKGLISDNATAISEEKTRAEAAEKAIADDLAILIGDDADKSVRAIAAEEVNTLIGGVSDADTITGITTLIEYVNTNGATVLEMQTAIGNNATAIEKLNGAVDVEGSVLYMIANEVPVATDTVAGRVKASSAVNGVSVAADGTMSVNAINVNNLVQTEGDSLVLNGGSANA